jgi:hypothetical protein
VGFEHPALLTSKTNERDNADPEVPSAMAAWNSSAKTNREGVAAVNMENRSPNLGEDVSVRGCVAALCFRSCGGLQQIQRATAFDQPSDDAP